MSKSGPIIILEDDPDDQNIMEEIFVDLLIQNERIWFSNTKDAFEFLKKTPAQPFIIFSDINLPGETGLQFKNEIDDDPQLRKKSIPFVFYSTSVDQHTVDVAYTQLTVQGFFQKPHNYEDMKKQIKLIVDYWCNCKHPNS